MVNIFFIIKRVLFIITITSIFFEPGYCLSKKNSPPFKSPNIIFIMADDLGWSDLPAYENKFNEAPNLDKLASEGMRFVNAYTAGPVCSPTRASIQSGQYPARVGVIDFITGHWRPYEKVIVPKNRTQYLPQNIITIGEILKDAGYATGYFGKWHLGNKSEHHPLNQGYNEANVSQGRHYNVKFDPPCKVDSAKRLSELLTDFAEKFIKKHCYRPFFLFISHYDVHVQLDADHDLIEKYLNKDKLDDYPCNPVYAAMIEHLDRSVGRIVAELKKNGLEEKSIVIFYSDNGGLILRGDKNTLIAPNSLKYQKDSPLKYIATSNTPLRSEKGTVYEGGIRVPLIVRWPNIIKPGTICDALVTSVDFYPTFLELASAEKPNDQILDGKSIVSEFFENKYNYERAIYWHYPVYHHDVPASAIRKGNWKLIENLVTKELTLYNLKFNMSESNDLKSIYPAKTQELYSLLKNWQKEVGARFPVSNPDFDPLKREEMGRHPDRN